LEAVALLLNGSGVALEFTLPGSYAWRVLIDSADGSVYAKPAHDAPYTVAGHAAAIAVATLPPPESGA
jgi:hypothetical protein